MNGETAMKFELTLAQRRDDSTDVGPTLGQPGQPTLLSGVVPVGAISVLRRGLVWGRSGQDRFSMGSFWSRGRGSDHEKRTDRIPSPFHEKIST